MTTRKRNSKPKIKKMLRVSLLPSDPMAHIVLLTLKCLFNDNEWDTIYPFEKKRIFPESVNSESWEKSLAKSLEATEASVITIAVTMEIESVIVSVTTMEIQSVIVSAAETASSKKKRKKKSKKSENVVEKPRGRWNWKNKEYCSSKSCQWTHNPEFKNFKK